jgi:hypothetical protein
MSMIGQFRYNGASGSAAVSNSIVNIGSFKVSGLSNIAGLAVCLYAYDATTKIWKPYTQ